MICAVIGILLLAIVAWLAVSGLRMRDLARAPAIACGRCGHFLAPDQRSCPECGTAWDDVWLARLTAARRRSGTYRLALASAVLLLIAVGIVAAVLPLITYLDRAPTAAPLR